MSVIINTNSSATAAANNLAGSNALLQKSLNRLSSGSKIVSPADDAGGLAVSMKLSAAAKRQGAVSNNIGNAVSRMQTQDGVLKVTGAILNRISELKVLNADITKSSSDKANYNTEFKALQAQITANATEAFNGVALFGTTDLSVATTEDGSSSSAVTLKGVNLLGGSASAAFAPFSDNFANLSNWTDTSQGGGVSVSGNVLDLDGSTGHAEITSKQSFSGAFSISYTVRFPLGVDDVAVGFDGVRTLDHFLSAVIGSGSSDTGPHSVRIDFDGAGTANTYMDGSSTPSETRTGLITTGGTIFLNNGCLDHALVSNFSITSTPTSSPSNVGTVASASNLSSLNLSTVTSAIQDVATYRAENGASQSRLGYANELLSTNKANLEAATSRIMDVDVAAESTQLARFNILVQAGTSMLSQANQSSQSVLRLIS